MPMINAGEWKKGMKLIVEGEPYDVLICEFVKPGKGQAIYKLKLKNLLRPGILDRNYRSGDSLESADVRKSPGQYMYRDANNLMFLDDSTFEQFELSIEVAGDMAQFLLEGTKCDLMFYNEKLIAVDPPSHIILAVTYTEPAARGNTANNVTKEATVETGAVIQVPAFVEMGDKLKIDIRTGTYVERANK
jgi:elongation factor P